MQRLFFVAVSFVIMGSFGCAKGPETPQNAAPSKMVSPHSKGSVSPESPSRQAYVAIVAKQKLPEFDSKTIGAIFEDYRFFSSREWNETKNPAGKVYVDFKGLFVNDALNVENIQQGVARQGIEVKFVVEPDGAFYVGMVSRIEVRTDGKMYLYPISDGKKVVEKIYGNKKISF